MGIYTDRERKTIIHLWVFEDSFQISVLSTFCHSGLAAPFPKLRKRVVFFSGTLSLRDYTHQICLKHVYELFRLTWFKFVFFIKTAYNTFIDCKN